MIVYTKIGCGRCVVLKKLLDAKGIGYETVDNNDEVDNMSRVTGILELPILNMDGVLYSGSEAVLYVKGIK